MFGLGAYMEVLEGHGIMAVEFFESVKSIFTRRAEEKIADYRSLVSAVAAGKKPPAAEKVVAILEEANKTAENFEADVGTVKNRETWRKEIAELAELRESLAELNRKKSALSEAHKVEVAEMANRHGKAFDAIQEEWQNKFSRMSVLERSDPRSKLISSSSEFDAVRAVANTAPDRADDEVLRQARDAALNAVSTVKGKLRELAGAKQDALGVWPSRDNSGPLNQQLAAAESRLAQVDAAITRRAAEWKAYHDRCSAAESAALAS